jgi:hypothetical protein
MDYEGERQGLLLKVARVHSFLYDNKLVPAYSTIGIVVAKLEALLPDKKALEAYKRFAIPVQGEIWNGHVIDAWRTCEAFMGFLKGDSGGNGRNNKDSATDCGNQMPDMPEADT